MQAPFIKFFLKNKYAIKSVLKFLEYCRVVPYILLLLLLLLPSLIHQAIKSCLLHAIWVVACNSQSSSLFCPLIKTRPQPHSTEARTSTSTPAWHGTPFFSLHFTEHLPCALIRWTARTVASSQILRPCAIDVGPLLLTWSRQQAHLPSLSASRTVPRPPFQHLSRRARHHRVHHVLGVPRRSWTLDAPAAPKIFKPVRHHVSIRTL
jgi:hypothetical protein